MKQNVRISRKMLLGAGGGGDSGFQVKRMIEGFFVGLKYSIPGCFRLVFHLRGDFLRIENNLKLSFLCY